MMEKPLRVDTTIECTRSDRQPGDPSGEAALAPLKGELAARTG